MNILEKRRALEQLLALAVTQAKQLSTQQKNILTDIVKLEGKLELLKEFEAEEKKPKSG